MKCNLSLKCSLYQFQVREAQWLGSVLAEATALCSLLRPGVLIDTDEFSAGGNLAIAKHLVQWGVELFLVSSYRRRSR